jgi:hypothetical protein
LNSKSRENSGEAMPKKRGTEQKLGARDIKTLDNLNSAQVTKKDIIRVLDAANKAHTEGHEADMLGPYTTTKLFRKNPQKAQSIYFRMQALAEMLENNELPGWTLEKLKDGSIPAEDAVFAAVAEHHLTIIEDQFTFERKSFLERILVLAEPEGKGRM